MKIKYPIAKANPIGHQIEARTRALWLAAVAYAESEFSGASVECNITGKIAAPPVANKPTMRKFEARNARISLRVEKPEISMAVERKITSNPIQQTRLWTACTGTSGRTTKDSTEISANSGTTANQRYF